MAPRDTSLRKGIVRRRTLRVEHGGARGEREDDLAAEEPLEIRIAGEVFGVTMRTPGHDHELAAGLLLSEGLIRSHLDVSSIAHCGKPGDEGYGNVLDVTPGPGSGFDPETVERLRRRTATTSACGVCGRITIDDLSARSAPASDATRFDHHVLQALAEQLRPAQANFQKTGGSHAAAIADAEGRLHALREDVGRHNAVDKAIGRQLLDRALPLAGRLLVVSGRTSFEIVQKAVAAGLAGVLGISAPSSLSVATAERFGLLLIGFARGGTYNVYSGATRVRFPGE